jgi:hypothetical protein
MEQEGQTIEFKFAEIGPPGLMDVDNSDNPSADMLYHCYRIMHAAFYTIDFVLEGRELPNPKGREDFMSEWTNVIGDLFPGAPVKRYVCATVLGSEVISCCLLLEKPGNTFEVWNVASNPEYIRTGGVKFMFYNIYYRIMENTKSYKVNLRLESARNSYPYINFYERFKVYARVGFTPYSGRMRISDGDGNIQQIEFASPLSLMFTGPVYTNCSSAVVVSPGNPLTRLTEYSEKYPIAYPDETRFLMTTFPDEEMNIGMISQEIQVLKSSGYSISPIDRTLPNTQFGWISHTGYIYETRDNTPSEIPMFKVPEGFELLIFNSPGSFTYTPQVRENWNFNIDFLSGQSIGYLKLIFPGYKAVNGRIPIPNTAVPKSYGQYVTSTGDTPAFYVDNNTDGGNSEDSKVVYQIHSYGPGDFCPEMLLSCDFSTEKEGVDFAARFSGKYLLSGDSARWTDIRPPISALRGDTHDSIVEKQKEKTLYVQRLSDLLKTAPEGKTRLCMFGCGSLVDDRVDYAQRNAMDIDKAPIPAPAPVPAPVPVPEEVSPPAPGLARTSSSSSSTMQVEAASPVTPETVSAQIVARAWQEEEDSSKPDAPPGRYSPLDILIQSVSRSKMTRHIPVHPANYKTFLQRFGESIKNALQPIPAGAPAEGGRRRTFRRQKQKKGRNRRTLRLSRRPRQFK